MPDIGFLPELQPDLASPCIVNAGRAVLVSAVLTGVALAALTTSAEDTARALYAAGPELSRLLRAMAGLKLMVVMGVLAAITWRLARPAEPWRLASYAVAAAAMAAGPVLIWQMVHVTSGALLLHGGLLMGALLFWRDPAVAARLAIILAVRQARLAGRVRS